MRTHHEEDQGAGAPGLLDCTGASSRTSIDLDGAKRHEAVRTALARRGYLLCPQADGSFLIARWDRSCDLKDLDAVERFMRLVGEAA